MKFGKFSKFRINQTTGIAIVCAFILIGMMCCNTTNDRVPAYYEGLDNGTDDMDKKKEEGISMEQINKLMKLASDGSPLGKV